MVVATPSYILATRVAFRTALVRVNVMLRGPVVKLRKLTRRKEKHVLTISLVLIGLSSPSTLETKNTKLATNL